MEKLHKQLASDKHLAEGWPVEYGEGKLTKCSFYVSLFFYLHDFKCDWHTLTFLQWIAKAKKQKIMHS